MSDTLENMNLLAHMEFNGFYTAAEEPRAKSGFNIEQITLSLWSRHFLVALLKISPLPSNLCCGISTAMLSRYLYLQTKYWYKYILYNIFVQISNKDKSSHQKLEHSSKQIQPHHWNELHCSLSLRALLSETSPKCPTLSESSLSQRP